MLPLAVAAARGCGRRARPVVWSVGRPREELRRRLPARWATTARASPIHDDEDVEHDDVRMVAAAAEGNLVIGREGQLPWELPEDRRHFFRLTHGHILVLGRRSYEESGHALPGRDTIVVSGTLDQLPDAHVVPSLDEALAIARRLKRERGLAIGSKLITWIAGGHDLYLEAMRRSRQPSRCDLLYLTRVHVETHGDTCFPAAYPEYYPHLLWSWDSATAPCTYQIYGHRLAWERRRQQRHRQQQQQQQEKPRRG